MLERPQAMLNLIEVNSVEVLSAYDWFTVIQKSKRDVLIRVGKIIIGIGKIVIKYTICL